MPLHTMYAMTEETALWRTLKKEKLVLEHFEELTVG